MAKKCFVKAASVPPPIGRDMFIRFVDDVGEDLAKAGAEEVQADCICIVYPRCVL